MGKWKEGVGRDDKRSGRPQHRKRRHGDGLFKDDNKMPIYSDREFAACSPLLSLQIDIESTLDRESGTIVTGGEIVPLKEARRREQELEAEYRRVVTEETLAAKPEATERDIAIRMYDIKKSIESTDHISVQYTDDFPGDNSGKGGGYGGRG